jgi:threonine/homoserine/homoserine lactone efflux protein
MLAFALQGLGLGFTAVATPGPLQTFLINTTLAQGWRRSLVIVLTPLVTDIPIVLVIVFLLGELPAAIIRPLQIFGGLFLLWIAYGAYRQLRAGVTFGASGEASGSGRTLGQSVVMSWLSPGPYLFWATINGPLLKQGLAESVLHGLAFLIGFYGTFVGMLTVLVFVFDRMRQLDPRVTRGMLAASIVILVIFSLRLLAQGLFANAVA